MGIHIPIRTGSFLSKSHPKSSLSLSVLRKWLLHSHELDCSHTQRGAFQAVTFQPRYIYFAVRGKFLRNEIKHLKLRYLKNALISYRPAIGAMKGK